MLIFIGILAISSWLEEKITTTYIFSEEITAGQNTQPAKESDSTYQIVKASNIDFVKPSLRYHKGLKKCTCNESIR